MKVFELLTEEAINVQQDSKKLLKSLGDVCREHDCTMELDQSMGASVGKTGSYWSGAFRLKKAAQGKMDIDEQKLTLKILRMDIIKWLKALQAEGRAIGTKKPPNGVSKQPLDMTTDPATLLDTDSVGWDGMPYFKGYFFIGIPEGAAPETVIRLDGYGIKDIDSRKEEKHDRGSQAWTYVTYKAVPMDFAVAFTDEAEAKVLFKTLSAARKKDKAVMIKLMIALIHATGSAPANMGYDDYKTKKMWPLNTPKQVDDFLAGSEETPGVNVKKGIKSKATIMVDKEMLVKLMKDVGIST